MAGMGRLIGVGIGTISRSPDLEPTQRLTFASDEKRKARQLLLCMESEGGSDTFRSWICS